MIRRIFLITLLSICLAAETVVAQTNDIVIDNLVINIQPEYDRPGVLIIYDIQFTPDTPLQSRITIHIPREAGRPNAVAYYGQDDGLYSINYDAEADGDWLGVSFIAPTQKIRLEYYDPGLVKWGKARNYVYRWTGDYIVNNMTIFVQQPRNATKFTMQPETGFGFKGTDGLIYYQYEVGNVLQDGRIFKVTLSYEKPDDSFSAQLEPVEPVVSLPQVEVRTAQSQQILPWVFGILGILLITGGWFWYWYSGKTLSNRRKPYQRHRARFPAGQTEQAVFCHRCGRRAQPEDIYCRDCGTQLMRNG